jgi:hypothetical protein
MTPKSKPVSHSAEAEVIVHPALAEFALQTKQFQQYTVYLIMLFLSEHDEGVETCEVVCLAKRIRFRQKSSIYKILERGRGVWWDRDTQGRWVRTGFGRQALFRRFDLRVRDCPKRVPISALKSPKSVFLACLHSSEEWNRQSRAAIARRTGMSRDAQLRAEKHLAPIKRSVHADLDRFDLSPDERERWGGVWQNPRTGRLSKQLPNEYRSPFPDAPYGRVSRTSRRRTRFRRFRGRGREDVRREPFKRYFDNVKAGTRAASPKGLRADEVLGPVFVEAGNHTVCVRLPVLNHPRTKVPGRSTVEGTGDKQETLRRCILELAALAETIHVFPESATH